MIHTIKIDMSESYIIKCTSSGSYLKIRGSIWYVYLKHGLMIISLTNRSLYLDQTEKVVVVVVLQCTSETEFIIDCRMYLLLILQLGIFLWNYILLGCVYRPKNSISIEPSMSILTNLSVILIVIYWWTAVLLMTCVPTNILSPTDFTATNNTFLYLFFVSGQSKVLLYDQQ